MLPTGTSKLYWNVLLPHPPSQMVNYCTREYSIELLMLWLDVEHFRGFDGDQEDLTLMAQHLGEQLHTPVSVCVLLGEKPDSIRYCSYRLSLVLHTCRESVSKSSYSIANWADLQEFFLHSYGHSIHTSIVHLIYICNYNRKWGQ